MPDPTPAAAPTPEPAAAQAGDPPGDRVIFRLAMFGAVLVLVISTGFAIGRIGGGDGPDPSAAPSASAAAVSDGHAATGGEHTGGAAEVAAHDDTGTAPHVHNADGTVAAAAAGGTGAQVGGLAVSSAGLTLVPEATTFPAGRSQPFRFRITGADGTAVTAFAVLHDKPLHLIAVRRDLSGYQHLHPTMSAEGIWSVDLTLAAAGSWRVYADFSAVVGGRPTPATLGIDLDVTGTYAPQPLPAPANQAATDGYTVNYEGSTRIGATQPLLVRVTKAGAPVTLEPYLAAYGHLVVLRAGDLGYVHVHPEPDLVDGAVKFWLAAPGPGRYRMFFDFQVAGEVHTAAFTTKVN